MPHCDNCAAKWSWADSIKISFKNKKHCPACGTMQYLKSHSNTKAFYAAAAFPFILNIIRPYLDIPMNVFTVFIVLYIIALFVVLPYAVNLSDQPKSRR